MICKFCGESDFILLNDFYMKKNTTSDLSLDEEIRVKVEVCKNCGLGVNSTPMSKEELENYYKHYSSSISYFDNSTPSFFQDSILNLDIYKKYLTNCNSKIVEIGCNDGYFIDIIQKKAKTDWGGDCLFTNFMGIEPSEEAEIGIKHGLNIKKDYFRAGYFKDKVDVFILRQVFEHLENPFDMFNNMVEQLSDDGYIILETPNLDVFCTIHLNYFSWPFYEKMAHKYGMKIIDCKITRPLDSYSNICVVFAKQQNKACEIKCNYTITDVIEERKKDIILRMEEYYENTKKIKKFLKDKRRVYWWGSGGDSISYLNTVQNLKINNCEIIPVNLMPKRKGYQLPACSRPTCLPQDIQNTNIEGSVIATILIDDVLNAMKKYNIKSDAILNINGLE